jgi:hypothetical protein
MKPTLINIVREWLKDNRPFMFIDVGSISARGNGARYFYADVEDTYVEILTNLPGRNELYATVRIEAADPEFFTKLDKHLPKNL